ncbi:MAG TPA: hypothetical protein VFO63_12480 [Blastocatellia bacterium]|nr:hypothetical protein [Blastocatellia bacterium]
MKYYKNGLLIYTSARTPTYPLLVDTAFGEVGATITNAKISGDSGLANLSAPMSFDGTIQFDAILGLPAFDQRGNANLVDYLMIGRREYLLFSRRVEQG